MNSIACSRLRILGGVSFSASSAEEERVLGKMLRLTYVQLDILGFSVLADNHSAVDFFAGADKENAALLSGEEAVGNGFARFKSDQGTLFAVLEISFIGSVSVKHSIQNTGSLGGGQEFVAESDKAAGRNVEFQTHGTVAGGAHSLKFALTFA